MEFSEVCCGGMITGDVKLNIASSLVILQGYILVLTLVYMLVTRVWNIGLWSSRRSVLGGDYTVRNMKSLVILRDMT